MKHFTRTTLSVLLSLIMMLTMCSAAAFAAGDEEITFEGFTRLKTADDGTLSNGETWFDLEAYIEGSGMDDGSASVYRTYMSFHLSDDGETFRVASRESYNDFSRDMFPVGYEAYSYFAYLLVYESSGPVFEGYDLLPTADSDDLEIGAYWFNLEGYLANLDLTEESIAMYRAYTYYLSDDGNTLLAVNDDEIILNIEKENEEDVDPFDFLYQHGVSPYEGFNCLPTVDNDNLEDGAYWFALEEFITTLQLSEENAATFSAALYYINTDGDRIRMKTGSVVTDITTESDPYVFVFLHRHNAASDFIPLPFADSADLQEGDFWYDLAGVLKIEGISEDDPVFQDFFENSSFYLSADLDLIVAFINGELEMYDSESDAIIFAFLHPHGYTQDRDGFVEVVRDPANVTDGCWYFDMEGFLDAAIAEENAARVLDGNDPLTAEEEAQYRANIENGISGYTLFFNPATETIIIPFGATDIVVTDEIPTTNAYSQILPHIYNVFTANLDATCTTDGYTGALAITKNDETVILKEGTLIPGGHVSGQAVKENDHPSTCNELGYYESVVYCVNCPTEISRTRVDYTAYGAHEFGEMVREKSATCTATGVKAHKTCSVCKKNFDANGVEIDDLSIPQLAHTPQAAVKENVTAATCTAAGSYDNVVYCSVCDNVISSTHKTIPAAGHTWGEWTVTKEATETEKGEKTRECSVCHETETAEIPVVGSNLCKWCGEDHSGNFIQKIIGFFHSILYFFAHLFGKR